MANEEKTKKTTTSKKATPAKKSTAASATKKKTVSKSTKTPSKKTTSKTTTKKVTPKETKIIQEENSYGRTLIAALLIAILFLGGYIAVQYKKNGGFGDKPVYVATQDEKQFKKDYESLNGTTTVSGEKNKEIKILEDNNIKYITLEEAATILDSESGVIYFGFASCQYCRNAVPVLLDAMKSSDLDTIYYVNIRPEEKEENDLRNFYKLNEKNKIRILKEADPSYRDVVRALANYLDDYVLYNSKGKKYNVGEKRLYAPTVVSVVDGVIVGFHQGTVENHEYDENKNLKDLTKEQKQELLNTYSKVISAYLNDTCIEEEGC